MSCACRARARARASSASPRPTTDDRRLPAVLQNTSGFLYYVSVTGMTGVKKAEADRVAPEVARIKRQTDLPVAVGFGIREPEQAAEHRPDRRRRRGRLGPGRGGRQAPGGLAWAVGASTRRWPAWPRCTGARGVSWLTNYVRPRIRALYRAASPTSRRISGTSAPLRGDDLPPRPGAEPARCPPCSLHMRVGPDHRFRTLFDEDSWPGSSCPRRRRPAAFRDQKTLHGPPEGAQGRTKANDALEAAWGPSRPARGDRGQELRLHGRLAGGGPGRGLPHGGPGGRGPAGGLRRRHRLGRGADAGGAISLMQMARTTIALEEVKEAGLPYIVMLTDPTTGGVIASYAMLGDIHLAEPGAMIGFAGRRVIEQTIRENLPQGFQRAEFLVEHGMVDRVVHGSRLRETLAHILTTCCSGPSAPRMPVSCPNRSTGRNRSCRSPSPIPARAGHDEPRRDLILERLKALHPKRIDLSLGRIERLLAALGNPERHLPPVVHMAGTNGKGTTVAMLTAIARRGPQGPRYISPHLVRFAERIRLAGEPIAEDALADLLERWSAPMTARRSPSSRSPRRRLPRLRRPAGRLAPAGDGAGRRFDATNVVDPPRSRDHVRVDRTRNSSAPTWARSPGRRPGSSSRALLAIIGRQRSASSGRRSSAVPPRSALRSCFTAATGKRRAVGRSVSSSRPRTCRLELPRPALPGVHQIDNAGLAVMAALSLAEAGLEEAEIMPRPAHRPLAGPPAAPDAGTGWSSALPRRERRCWLDGGHNPAAGEALAAQHRPPRTTGGPCTSIVGMLAHQGSARLPEPAREHRREPHCRADPRRASSTPARGGCRRCGGARSCGLGPAQSRGGGRGASAFPRPRADLRLPLPRW